MRQSPNKLTEKRSPIKGNIQDILNSQQKTQAKQEGVQPLKQEYQLSLEVQKIIEEYKNKMTVQNAQSTSMQSQLVAQSSDYHAVPKE